MRIVSFEGNNGKAIGRVNDNGIVDITARSKGKWTSLLDVIENESLTEIDNLTRRADADWKFHNVRFLPPVPEARYFCIGINYRSHAEETERAANLMPSVFIRLPESVVGHLNHLVRPKVSEQLDFEGEFAVVIGKRARSIDRSEVFSRIAGYTCFNDGSVRDFQKHSVTAGKNFTASGSCGPWMLTADEMRSLDETTLQTRIDGEVMQSAPVSDLINDVPAVIAYISQFTELRPGDVIATGTPAGVGSRRQPPRWLKPGELLEVEISGIGTLQNPVTD